MPPLSRLSLTLLALAATLAVLPREARADSPSFDGARMVAMDELTMPWATSRPLAPASVVDEVVEPWSRPRSVVTALVELSNPWPGYASSPAVAAPELLDPWARPARRR